MNSDEFYVTLPSDSSINYFPDNTLARYTTKLAHPLIFQPGEKWKVAVMEISYPYGFDTLDSEIVAGKQMTINIIVTKVGRIIFPARKYSSFEDLYKTIRDSISDKGKQEALLNELAVYITRDQNHISVLKKSKQIWKPDVTPIISDFINYLDVQIPGKTPVLVSVNFPVRVYYGFDDLISTIRSRLPTLAVLAVANDQIRKLMLDDVQSLQLLPTRRIGAFYGDTEPVYLYTDIIEPQLVGDSYVRSLRVIHFPNPQGQHYFVTPYYFPVEKNIIETISISLITKLGNFAKFEVSPEATIVVLHFIKR